MTPKLTQKRSSWALKNGQCEKIPEVHRENCTGFDIAWKTSQVFYDSVQSFQNLKVDPSPKLSSACSGFTYFFCIFGHLSTAFSPWLCLLWVNSWMCHSWKVRSPEGAARVAIILLLNLELLQSIECPLRASSVWKAMELCQEVTTRRN